MKGGRGKAVHVRELEHGARVLTNDESLKQETVMEMMTTETKEWETPSDGGKRAG